MKTYNYVRANRLRWSLSQQELADLLGISQGLVSKIEIGSQRPDFTVALSLQVIFGRAPRSIFPNLYLPIEEAVMGRAAKLDRQIAGKSDSFSVRKRELLTTMMERTAPTDA